MYLNAKSDNWCDEVISSYKDQTEGELIFTENLKTVLLIRYSKHEMKSQQDNDENFRSTFLPELR